MAANVVPFGKYKGRPIETLAQDQEYCEWLSGQDWFRTRYAAIHTLIVNNFGEPNETPEHNALQALFTDTAWVEAFVWAWLGPQWWPDVITDDWEDMDSTVEQAIVEFEEYSKRQKASLQLSWRWGDTCSSDYKKERTEASNELDRRLEKLSRTLKEKRDIYQRRVTWLNSGITPGLHIGLPKFENEGIDVQFSVGIYAKAPSEVSFSISAGGHKSLFASLDNVFLLHVELKATLGDDYPAVLRQMIAQGKGNAKDTMIVKPSRVLLLGRGGYQGIGATYEQVEKMFRASHIDIVLLADINIPCAPDRLLARLTDMAAGQNTKPAAA